MTRARDVANIDGVLTTTGDTYYASAAATPARLGIGSNGQYLTVSGGLPAWGAVSAGAGNMAQIATGTLSGSSVTLSSLSSYTDLLLLISGANNATSNTTYGIRVNNNSGSNYRYVGTVSPNDVTTSLINTGTTAFYHERDTNRTTTNSFAVKFTNCKNPGFTDVIYDGFVIGDNGQPYPTRYKGAYMVSEAVSSLVIFTVGGQSFNAGTYYLFGA